MNALESGTLPIADHVKGRGGGGGRRKIKGGGGGKICERRI